MFTKNMLKFLESLKYLADENDYWIEIEINGLLESVKVYFGGNNGRDVGHVYATFDAINRTETPTHLALNLFNQMEHSII